MFALLQAWKPLCRKKTLEIFLGGFVLFRFSSVVLCYLCLFPFGRRLREKTKLKKRVSWLLVCVEEMVPRWDCGGGRPPFCLLARYWYPGCVTSGPVSSEDLLPHHLTTIPTCHWDKHIQRKRERHTHTHAHTCRTCWPVLLRRREMLSNSAFQHSTSDYLFSFTGRFELVMCFPRQCGAWSPPPPPDPFLAPSPSHLNTANSSHSHPNYLPSPITAVHVDTPLRRLQNAFRKRNTNTHPILLCHMYTVVILLHSETFLLISGFYLQARAL